MIDAKLSHDPCWYAVHTRSNHEKRVKDALVGRDIECYMPTYECVSQWKDRRVKLERPLFSGYVFARIAASARGSVTSVPSVVNVLCERSCDAIGDDYIHRLRVGLQQRRAESHPYLTVGNVVEIVAGPFCGMEGVLLQQRNINRVVISIPSIMRALVIEVGLDEVRGKILPGQIAVVNSSSQVA